MWEALAMIDVTNDLHHTAPLHEGRVLISESVHMELKVEALLRIGHVCLLQNDPTITRGAVYRMLLGRLVYAWATEASAAFCTSERDIRLRQEGMFRYMLGRFPDGVTLFHNGVYRGVLADNALSISHVTPPVA
jgi:hypothetical protein